jgi:predicted secreted Zn-dependent protease
VKWIRSSECSGGECVEVTFDPNSETEHVGVRASYMPADVIWFSRDEWDAFLKGARNHEFDI